MTEAFQHHELTIVISYSRLHNNILSPEQCILIHQYANGQNKNELSNSLWIKINEILDIIERKNWKQPDQLWDDEARKWTIS